MTSAIVSVPSTIKDVNTRLVKKQELIFFIVTSLLVLVYGENNFLDLLICIIFSVSLFFLNEKYFNLLFITLLFFKQALVFPNIMFLSSSYGTLFRLFQLVFIIRASALLLIGKKKFTLRISTLFFIILFSIYSFKDILYTSNFDSLSTIINFIIICVLQLYFTKNEENFKLLSLSLGLYALLSCVYGFLRGSSIESWISINHFSRFSGAFEPNFTALYCNIGIMALICSKAPSSNILRALIMGLLYIFLFMTASMTGLITNIIVILFYGILRLKNKKGLRIFLTGTVILVTILVTSSVFIPQSFSNLRERIDLKISSYQSGDFNKLDSGRSNLKIYYMQAYSSQGLLDKLFGANVNFRNSLIANNNYSHSIYIDSLMTYGIFGTLLIFGYILYRFLLSLRLYLINKDDISLANICQKVIILVTGITLSLMGDKVFLLFAFL